MSDERNRAPLLAPEFIEPNLTGYDETRRAFSWDNAAADLGRPAGRLNIAHEALNRHVAAGRGDRTAIRWLPKQGDPVDISYTELADQAGRFAAVLVELGHGRGTRVATLAGRIPELYTAALGTLKVGAVLSPLFAAFGPEPIRLRIDLGRIEVLVTTPVLYRRKVQAIRHELSSLRHVFLVGHDIVEDAAVERGGDGLIDLRARLANAPSGFETAPTGPEDPALIHFTSGTTGTPKAALHVHQAVIAHHVTGQLVLDLHPDDVYWCTADPGWVTGTSYGIISPLTNGVTSIVDEAEFDADRWYGILQDQRVDVWYTAPTALRMLMRIGTDAAHDYRFRRLRLVASVGEPLNPEVVRWAQDTYRVPVLDNWWQSETGGIMVANYRSTTVKPGSMGRPLPGIEVAILARDNDDLVLVDGDPVEITAPDEPGELALRSGWPSMFRGYLGDDERYRSSFVGPWYRTGDLATKDVEGYLWFVGRSDDVIKSAGHLIGPFEVESVLIEHPAVAEAGVFGKPDEVAGNIIAAHVLLAPGVAESDELRSDIISFARKRLGTVAAPRELTVADVLPKTRSGKIMRRLLRARELGLPEGDLSTLETGT